MSAIQVKNVPVDLHERLRKRAHGQGQSIGSYVLGLIELDLALPTTKEWLEQLKQLEPVTGVSRERVLQLIHEGRDERDEQIAAAVSRH